MIWLDKLFAKNKKKINHTKELLFKKKEFFRRTLSKATTTLNINE